ncbi:MAG: M20/M25/M40 family metallo-hydrolase, partial [Bacteroidetes bacterium]
VILQVEKKLMHSASSVQENYTLIHLHRDVAEHWPDNVRYQLKINSRLETVKSENIYAFIPGTVYPDSFIVFSAHYDHLGNIDTVYFPGANDNASGVAVLLDLMHHYKTYPHKYSVAFFFFTGEEIGLKGSEYYVQHPLFDLKRIKFLINLDLMGGGSEGIMVVNGKVFQKEYERFEKINITQNHNLTIKSRGKAQNSDHYWFSENGVKCFFIYTLGDIENYHNTQDKHEYLIFNNYPSIFQLIVQFMSEI